MGAMPSLRTVAERLGVAVDADAGEQVITGISQDSRLVRGGDLYAALPGMRHHGAQFAPQAAAQGAVAMLSDRPSSALRTLAVPHPRRALGPLAAWLYGAPSKALDVYGITGTNGKTSTAYLLDAGLAAAGLTTGLVSGVTVRGPRHARPATRTTPEACELQRALAEFRREQVQAVAMEVSSHGLALNRVDGTKFRVGVFTNLARDHLDFHTSMESYFQAKTRLFEPERCAHAVIGTDGSYGRRLAAGITGPCLTFATTHTAADIYADGIQADETGTSFTIHGAAGCARLRLPLLGAHQVDNALAAIAALTASKVDLDAAFEGLETLTRVPGRMESIDAGQPFLAYVDYMHNTAGQRRLFPYLRSLTHGRIIAVIGATGERDPTKRAPLGFTAAGYADTVIVTDESPHSEDPGALREDVASGARAARSARVLIESDRARAIAAAVAMARAGDVVVVAGRGHDRTQVFRNYTRPLDDAEVLRAAIRAR